MASTAPDPWRVDDGQLHNPWVLRLPGVMRWCPEGSIHMRRGLRRQYRGCTFPWGRCPMCCSRFLRDSSVLRGMDRCTRGWPAPAWHRSVRRRKAPLSRHPAHTHILWGTERSSSVRFAVDRCLPRRACMSSQSCRRKSQARTVSGRRTPSRTRFPRRTRRTRIGHARAGGCRSHTAARCTRPRGIACRRGTRCMPSCREQTGAFLLHTSHTPPAARPRFLCPVCTVSVPCCHCG
mmetsp:Transcript_53830/g.159493  ORF Transcript_53830/g.159493 Transcript_53830/m.159493 type:complete len:235 (-) Transcript_53830:352-1056(-)